MAEQEAHLQIDIDPGGAVSGAKKVEDSLIRIADSAARAWASLRQLEKFRGTAAAPVGGGARPGATPAAPSPSAPRNTGDAKSLGAAQRLGQALTEATRSSQAFGRAAARAADAATSAATALRAIRA